MKLFIVALLFGFVLTDQLSGSENSIQWSEQKEGIKVGVCRDTTFMNNGLIKIYVIGTANYSNNLVIPDVYQMFSFTLCGTNIGSIKVTPEGKKYGVKLQTSMPRSRRISRQLRFPDNEPLQIGYVKLDDIIKPISAQEAKFDIRLRLIKEKGKRLTPVEFGPIQMQIRIAP